MTAAIITVAILAFLGWCEWLDYKSSQNNTTDES